MSNTATIGKRENCTRAARIPVKAIGLCNGASGTSDSLRDPWLRLRYSNGLVVYANHKPTAWNVSATTPDVYASANPGCLLQVSAALRRAGKPLPVLHPVELLDASLRGGLKALRLRA